MANNLKIGAIVVLFLATLLAAIFVGEIGDSVDPLISTWSNNNETLDISGARLSIEEFSFNINESYRFTLAEDDWVDIDSIALGNGTLLTEDTDWNHTSTYIYMLNSSTLAENNSDYFIYNTTAVNYTFYPDDYVKHDVSRTLVNLLPLFFIIGGLLIVIGYFNRDFLKDLIKF